jgi:di/tricarboxylate transporter
MSLRLALVLALLADAILMFSLGRPRADAVALLMMVALPFTGVIDLREATAGFSNPNILLIAAMFVIGEGLARTGIAQGMEKPRGRSRIRSCIRGHPTPVLRHGIPDTR